MRILEACPFFCENLVASVKAETARGHVDELVVVESNRTFQNAPKEYVLAPELAAAPHIRHVRMDGARRFTSWPWALSKRPPFVRRGNPAWKNEARQRNLAAEELRRHVADDDVVILSDIDEILDWRNHQRLVDAAKRHGIVTVPLHVTVFFADLFSLDNGGPPGYSYRVFLMTGREFKRLRLSSDSLRKQGEAGRLTGSVPCLDKPMGFHHSWLGDAEFALRKLNAYSHSKSEHDGTLLKQGHYSIERIHEAFTKRQSFFSSPLEPLPDVELLPAVQRLRPRHPELFLPPS